MKWKDRFKQATVIAYLINELIFQLLLFYPLSMALTLSMGNEGQFGLGQFYYFIPLIGSLSGLLSLITLKKNSRLIWLFFFLLAKVGTLFYIFQQLFYSWFGWLLLLILAIGVGLVLRKSKKDFSQKMNTERKK